MINIADSFKKNDMKIKSTYIKSIIAIALIAIAGLQLLLLYNMYIAYHDITANSISQSFVQAIEDEFTNRRKQLGGPVSFGCYPFEQDTSAMRDMTIVTEDTTYIIPYNSSYRYNDQKAHQSVFKYLIPLNVQNLDSIFHQLLIEAGIPAKHTAIELYNIDKNDTIRTSILAKTPWLQYYETATVWVDLADSIGVKAWVQISYASIFQRMLFQLVLSMILIIAVVVCLFRLSSTIFRQRKEELMKQDYVNTLTHELKRPIASSLLVLEFLSTQINKNKQLSAGEMLPDAVFSLQKLNSYVEKIQEISQGESGSIELVKEPVPLFPFFSKLKTQYESSDGKNISVHLHIREDLYWPVDRIHFSNIMENLTENSIKYSDDSVSIEITVFQQDNQLHITHRDNGWGIAGSEIRWIFDKFYRGRSAEKRRKNGFGLGLSYVKIMIETMGGSISVASKEKEYTEFTLIIPA
jgi:two-component system phosphate regulon sensor histidine kinase PhoR